MDFPPVHIVDPQGPHTHTIILLHGRSSEGPEFAEELFASNSSSKQNLATHFPGFRWVFPTSKDRWSAVFQEESPAWFDIYSLTNTCAQQELQVTGLKESTLYILDLLKQEIDLLGGDSERIILGGMSLGMATALWAMLCLPARINGKIGAFLGFCGWLPFSDQIEKFLEVDGNTCDTIKSPDVIGMNKCPEISKLVLDIIGWPESQINKADSRMMLSTPTLLLHGSDDAYVDIELGRKAHQLLLQMGINADWKEYAGAESEGHWLKEPEGFDMAITFLSRVTVDN